jgi:hypothetical protein
MPDAAPVPGASEIVARFVAAPPAGAGLDAALQSARTRLAAARRALAGPTAASAPAERALAGAGLPLRRAFVDATVLAGSPATRADAAIVAAALAAHGEPEILAAIAVGCEVAARLRGALRLDAAWHADAVTARLGAAAAAARALGLDPTAARDALGLAATQAAGLGIVDGTPAGALGQGKAAADAVEGAVLARAGFTSAAASLEGRRGLGALMAAGFDDAALCADLGRRWLSAPD